MDFSGYTGVIDVDYIKYAVGYASEKRVLKAVHTRTGDEFVFKNRTEMYGRKKTKDGGWIELQNADGLDYKLDDFELFDIQVPEPIENVLYSAKQMMGRTIDMFDGKYLAFMGKGHSFRREHAKILEYKGNRADLLKPVHLDEISDYLCRKYKIEVVEGLEADDWTIIEGSAKDRIVVSIDKDTNGCGVTSWNPQHPDRAPIDCRGFGKLYIDESGKTKKYTGYGRAFFYYQIAYGDPVDNYYAAAASGVTWGEASAFHAMEGCRNDKEAWTKLVEIYKNLYPKPLIVNGWQGGEVDVTWLSMLQEIVDMAHMWRNPDDDFLFVPQILDRLGIEY